MAIAALDTLKIARKLRDAGVPEKQAEAQAEVMAETFVYTIDKLVTTDAMNARFNEQDTRIDGLFKEQDARLDGRFKEQDARVDGHFKQQDARIDTRFAELGGEMKLQRWILAAVAASTVVPALNSIFSWA